MTIYQLQQDIAEEIEQILSDMIFKDPQGKPTHLRSFKQDLPKREQSVVSLGNLMEEEGECDEDPYPFCIVRMEDGTVYPGAQMARTILVFGIFDDALDNLGHQTLLNAMHKVMERFIKNPVLKDMYQMNMKEGINWILAEEEKYPYFIGGLEMSWNAFFVEKEDRYV